MTDKDISTMIERNNHMINLVSEAQLHSLKCKQKLKKAKELFDDWPEDMNVKQETLERSTKMIEGIAGHLDYIIGEGLSLIDDMEGQV